MANAFVHDVSVMNQKGVGVAGPVDEDVKKNKQGEKGKQQRSRR